MVKQDLQRRVRVLEELVRLLIEAMPPGWPRRDGRMLLAGVLAMVVATLAQGRQLLREVLLEVVDDLATVEAWPLSEYGLDSPGKNLGQGYWCARDPGW